MRLPVDATLILLGEISENPSASPLLAAWTRERLPILRVEANAFAASDLEAALEAAGATTLVISGAGEIAAAVARGAAARGFRVFMVAETPLAELGANVARTVTCEAAVAAALRARDRERWKASRAAALLASGEANSKR